MATGEESNYNQPVKKECRKRLIEHAIKCLTTERNTSACVSRDHVQKVWKELRESGEVAGLFSKSEISNIEEEMKKWEVFHDSQIQTKKPSDLRVCYLVGDDPTNDLKVLVDNGVLCQNIWAIENDSQTLKKAWESNQQARKKMKIIRYFEGTFFDFLINGCEGKFDIIYFNTCGTLPSTEQKTLKAIGYIFLYERLASPGALITTFSFPPKQCEQANADQNKERKDLRTLFQKYLKYRLLNTSCNDNERNEDFLSGRADEDNYSDYISYQIIDTAYMYIPALIMLSSKTDSLLGQAFVNKVDFLKGVKKLWQRLEKVDHKRSQSKSDAGPKTEEIEIEDVNLDVSIHEELTGFLSQLGIEMESNSSTYCQTWVKEVLPESSKVLQLEISMLLTHHLTNSFGFIDKFSNEKFRENFLKPLLTFLESPSKSHDMQTTLDQNTATMVASLFYGQMASPSFPVLDKLLRLRYTAKQRQMFSDVFIFDQCRYVYQQFPSLSCASFDFFREGCQQMVFRMAVDGLRKHLALICSDVFKNCSVVNGYASFGHFPKRIEIGDLFIKEKGKSLLEQLKDKEPSEGQEGQEVIEGQQGQGGQEASEGQGGQEASEGQGGQEASEGQQGQETTM